MTSRIPTDMVADRTSKAKLSDTLGSMQTSINTNTSQLAEMTKLVIDVLKPPSPLVSAKGDGVTDDTNAIQACLNSASAYGGKVFLTPTLNGYLCNGTLTIPEHTTLEGVRSPNDPSVYNRESNANAPKGSLLLTTQGSGNASGTPFISLQRGSLVRGITIYHPNQTKTNPPIAYPWCIDFIGSSGSIENVMMINPFNGVRCVNQEKPVITHLYGQPLNIGIYLDAIYDVPRLNHIHFWCYWKEWVATDPLETYLLTSAIAFKFGRVDELLASNLFCYGYGTGILLEASEVTGVSSATYGNITNLDIDGSVYPIVVQSVSLSGVNITNFNLFAVNGGTSQCPLRVTSGSSGHIRLSKGNLFNGNPSASNMVYQYTGSGVEIRLDDVKFRGTYTGGAIRIDSASANFKAVNCQFLASTTTMDLGAIPSGSTPTIEIVESNMNGSYNVNNPNNIPYRLDKRIVHMGSAPTTGSWKVGEKVINSTPTVGQPKSWVCTTAGTPGIWTSEGNL